MIAFTLVYGGLGVVEFILLKKYVQAGPDAAMTGLLAGNGPVDDGGDGRPRGPEDRDDWPPDGPDTPDDESERLVFAY
jgi:hypothetical protein